MTAIDIALLSLVVHLAEYIETGEVMDMHAARSVSSLPHIAKQLEPNVMLPATRSGKSVAEILRDVFE